MLRSERKEGDKMTILRDLSIFWVMFHVIFLFLILFRLRFTRKKPYWAAELSEAELDMEPGKGSADMAAGIC